VVQVVHVEESGKRRKAEETKRHHEKNHIPAVESPFKMCTMSVLVCPR
jgi:hypothetical protein